MRQGNGIFNGVDEVVMSSSLRNHLPSKLFALRSIVSADVTSGWRIGTDERTTPRSEFGGIAKDCDVVVYRGICSYRNQCPRRENISS